MELEKFQLHEALRIRSTNDFMAELTKLQTSYSGNLEVTALLRTLDLEHYNRFSDKFARAMNYKVDLSMMWGLPATIIKASVPKQISPALARSFILTPYSA